MDEQQLGQSVSAIRKAQGISQIDLARSMERQGYPWTQSTVSAIERGERVLRASEIPALTSALGTTVTTLFEGNGAVAATAGLALIEASDKLSEALEFALERRVVWNAVPDRAKETWTVSAAPTAISPLIADTLTLRHMLDLWQINRREEWGNVPPANARLIPPANTPLDELLDM